jgi:hypothetical protein
VPSVPLGQLLGLASAAAVPASELAATCGVRVEDLLCARPSIELVGQVAEAVRRALWGRVERLGGIRAAEDTPPPFGIGEGAGDLPLPEICTHLSKKISGVKPEAIARLFPPVGARFGAGSIERPGPVSGACCGW